MKLQAEVNSSQLDEVDVTITVTMKLKEWKLISGSLIRDSRTEYQWTKTEVANQIGEIIHAYTDKVERTVEPK